MADKEAAARLKSARVAAGYTTAPEAAAALGIKEPTYLGHENGSRGFKGRAAQYARRFGVSFEWLVTGRGSRARRAAAPAEGTVPLVGFVSAGEAHFTAAGELGNVAAPGDPTDTTVAVEIRGDSLGSFFDRWIVFYDDVRRPMTEDLIGRPCVIGLVDGRVLIKKPQRSRTRGLFHLLSNTEPPILDAEIEWAARVKVMAPR